MRALYNPYLKQSIFTIYFLIQFIVYFLIYFIFIKLKKKLPMKHILKDRFIAYFKSWKQTISRKSVAFILINFSQKRRERPRIIHTISQVLESCIEYALSLFNVFCFVYVGAGYVESNFVVASQVCIYWIF